jgi:hypothetical protein
MDYTILPQWTAIANLNIGDSVFNGVRWLDITEYVRTLNRVTVTYGDAGTVTLFANERVLARRLAS